MSRTIFAVALLAVTKATEIVYRPTVPVERYRIDPAVTDEFGHDFKMAFKWPDGEFRCGATMISDQMALTAAHCFSRQENEVAGDLSVTLVSGETYGISEFRANKCWDFERNGDGGPYSADIAIMVLDRPIAGAVKGVDYVDIWNAATMDTVAGEDFILAGWG